MKIRSNTFFGFIVNKPLWLITCLLLLTACQSFPETALIATQLETPASTQTSAVSSTPILTLTMTGDFLLTSTPLPVAITYDPTNWRAWPVLPSVPEHAREIYLLGQSLGDDPHAFSVFGDCNSLPDEFMGVYDTDSLIVASLALNLQDTVAWFNGSFNRESPTVRAGTTTGALLWPFWHQNMYTCSVSETPLQCELRIHKPAFVIIQVGSHYEDRNEDYMRIILDQLLMAGVVPILATKADDIETNGQVNAQYAGLAVEYNIPFWNFWAATDGLPNHGLYSRPEDYYQGGFYLTDKAAAIHRLTALQALDIVRRAVMEP
jgi:hypothetical protein